MAEYEYCVGLSGVYRCECGASMITLKALNKLGSVVFEIPLVCEDKRHVRLSWLCAARSVLRRYVKDPVRREELFAALLAYFPEIDFNAPLLPP